MDGRTELLENSQFIKCNSALSLYCHTCQTLVTVQSMYAVQQWCKICMLTKLRTDHKPCTCSNYDEIDESCIIIKKLLLLLTAYSSWV